MSLKEHSDDEFIYALKYGIKDSVEDELADSCIRLLDLAGLRGCEIFAFCWDRTIDIFWHTEQKMKYNELRPYKHGDKEY